MKTKVSLKYFVTDYLWETFFDYNSHQTPSNLVFFDNFDNSKAFHTVLT